VHYSKFSKSRNQGWFIEKRYNSDGLFKKVIIRGGLLRKGITVMVYLKQVINIVESGMKHHKRKPDYDFFQ
jgi:hypothetical protein